MERTVSLALRLQFGLFELCPESHELRKHGLKLKLPPQAFCVLVCLVEKRGELVTREELFHKLWPGDTHVEFEGNLNSIIRVIRETLGDSAKSPRFIETEPKVGYRFIAPVSVVQHAVHMDAVPPLPPKRPSKLLIWVVAAVIALAGFWIAWRVFRADPISRYRRASLTQFTHFLGIATHPSFSPDGTHLAFQWNGNERGDYDIYVMRIGAQDLRRVTTDPADDRIPVWSPDGRDIAFLRTISDTQSALMLAPVLGGPERTVAVLPRARSLSWTPDGKWLAYSLSASDNELNPAVNEGISAVSLSTGKTMRITSSADGDSFPSFSPDGRWLAFSRSSDLWMVPIGDGLRAIAEPRRLTFESNGVSNPVWTPDGKSIIFTAARGSFGRLWRVQVADAKPTPAELGGEDAYEPVIDATGGRIAYSRATVVDSLNVLRPPDPPKKLVYSTKLARNPSVSPDGSRIAFESSRGGHTEIWTCGYDGSNLKPLTNLGGPPAGTPNWSPDGLQIVFDALLPEGSAIFTISSAGGVPRQITDGSTQNLVPSWSHDGKRIYFSSKRTGSLEVWSMSPDGSGAVQLTKRGGFRAVESHDGKFLYYSKGAIQTSIWSVPAAGGEETQLIPSLDYWQNLSVARAGIYYVPAFLGRSIPIHFYAFSTAASRLAGIVESLSFQGISVFPDGHTLVFSRRESSERDVMLMEIP